MAQSSLSLSGLLAILVVSYCTALIHPEDVQVFSAVVTNRAYIFSRTCVLQCELDYNPSTSEEVNQLIQSMDLQQMLQAFMFDKEHMHKSTSFQRLFACLGEHVGLDKRMKSARATEWLWMQLLEGAGEKCQYSHPVSPLCTLYTLRRCLRKCHAQRYCYYAREALSQGSDVEIQECWEVR